MSTQSFTKEDINQDWILVDAKDKTLGRLATKIANRLRGKHKPEFTPNSDLGDYVVVINSDLINVTGNKLSQKKYYRHTGYPGGIKEKNLEKVLEETSEEAIKSAVNGMLAKNKLGRQVIKKLKIYKDDSHPHKSQNPQLTEL